MARKHPTVLLADDDLESALGAYGASGEINGHVSTRSGIPPPGSDTRSILRFGTRYTVSAVRADAAVIIGLTTRDPGFGVAAGLTYVFNAFQLP